MKVITNEKKLQHYINAHKLNQCLPEKILQQGELHSYIPKEEIFCAGENLTYYYILMEGKFKVSYPFENGRSIILKFYEAPQSIGDMELIRNHPIRCDIEAVSDCTFLGFPVSFIRQDCLNEPQFLHYLINSLSDKLYATFNNEAYNLAYPLINRLASFLLELRDSSQQVTLEDTYEDISAFLGTTYRHLHRTLKELEQEHIITRKSKKITIKDPQTLEDLAKGNYNLQKK